MDKIEKASIELDSEAVQAAVAAGLDLSQVPTEALRRKIPGLHEAARERIAQEWYEDNKQAVDWYRQLIAEPGLFSDGLRKF